MDAPKGRGGGGNEVGGAPGGGGNPDGGSTLPGAGGGGKPAGMGRALLGPLTAGLMIVIPMEFTGGVGTAAAGVASSAFAEGASGFFSTFLPSSSAINDM